MVAIAFTAQNCAIVMATGAYGTALSTIQSDLGTSRAMAAAAPGVMLLSLGLLSPIIGNLLQRVTLRAAMTVGALLSAAGYVIVAYATNFTQVLIAYGLLIGPGACLLGPLTVSTLVSRWFERDRGKALGLANMPVFLLFTGPVAAFLLIEGGRELLFLVMAGIFVALVPLMRRIIDHPQQVGQQMRLLERSAQQPGPVRREPLTNKALLADPRFWLIGLAIGIFTGAGNIFVVHAVAMAGVKGVDLAGASSILSAFGIGTLVGGLFFGWLIDKIGPLPSLAANAGVQVCLWLLLIPASDLPTLLILAGFLGCGLGASVALHGATLNELFGPLSFSRAMGLSYFIKLPFLFGYAPLAGYLFDRTGSYDGALLLNCVGVGLAATIFLLMAVYEKGQLRKHLPGARVDS